MLRPPRTSWFRMALLSLILGTAGVVIGPRPAMGMGCHVDDRPTLGLSEPGEDDGKTVLDASPLEGRRPGIVPKPCTGEVPGSPDRPITPGPVFLPTSFRCDPPRASGRPTPLPAFLTSRLASLDRDRPPRIR